MSEQEIVEYLRYHYRELNKSQSEISLEINIPRHKIRRYLIKNNILYKDNDKDWLTNEIKSNKTYTQIEKENNMPRLSIWRAIQKFNLEELYREYRPKNRNDENEIIIYDYYAEVILCDKFGKNIGAVKIDIEDVDRVRLLKWHLGMGYAKTKIDEYKEIYMQDYLFEHNTDLTIDHKDRDKLNNRKDNFRLVTHSQNRMNKKLQSNNTSGISGVNWDKRYSKWRVRVKINSKEKQIGCFKTKEEAIQKRIDAEALYYGEYSANYNFDTGYVEFEFDGIIYTSKVNKTLINNK